MPPVRVNLAIPYIYLGKQGIVEARDSGSKGYWKGIVEARESHVYPLTISQ
jgi:hypothetical protein